MPDTVVWLTQSVLRTAIDPLRPTDNIRAGVALLRYHYGPSLVTPAWRWPPIIRDKPASRPGDYCPRPSTTWPTSCPCADASLPRAPITEVETTAQPASSSLDGAVFSPGTQRRTGRVRQGVIGALGRGQCSWEARRTAGARKAAAALRLHVLIGRAPRNCAGALCDATRPRPRRADSSALLQRQRRLAGVSLHLRLQGTPTALVVASPQGSGGARAGALAAVSPTPRAGRGSGVRHTGRHVSRTAAAISSRRARSCALSIPCGSAHKRPRRRPSTWW